jgi:hypothetical protein
VSEKASLSGMTVNERLFTLGLLAQIKTARAAWDTMSLDRIFELIGLPDYNVEQLRNS